jgi:hypothetical protein
MRASTINKEAVKEGYLWKIGKKTGMLCKRYFVLKEQALFSYSD